MATQFLIEEPDEPFEGPSPSLTPTEDGGAIINLDGEEFVDEPGIEAAEWDANLAELLPDETLRKIGSEVLDAVKADDDSREDWKKAIKDGMDLLGFINTPRSKPFEGACGVTYPLITEAAIKFQARAIAEMFPEGGPVDTVIIGQENDQVRDQAERVRDYLNYLLTEQDEGYYPDFDQMLLWLPILGSVFRKVWWDPSTQMVMSRYKHPDQIIVSYGSADIDTAPRVTDVLLYTPNEIKRLQLAGFYRDIDLIPVTQEAEGGPIQEKAAEVEGTEATQSDPSARRKVYEVHTELDIEEDPARHPDGLAVPYIVSIDEESQAVLAIRRSWREGDALFKRRAYFVHYRYLPGLGCYGFGLLHIAGGLARASTSLLRQLVDAGQFANLPGGFKAKGNKPEQNNVVVGPGEFKEIDVIDPTKPVSNMFAPLPYKEPSATLMNLLGLLNESGQRITSIADAEIGDGSTQQPVGTVLALIENHAQIQSSIHKRMHQAQRKEFRLLAEQVAEHAPQEGYPFAVKGGNQRVLAEDFDQRVDVVPVSDPKSFTATQRIAKAQFEMQLAGSAPPGLFNVKEVFKRSLKRAGIDDVDAILMPDPPQPYTGDPNSENMAAASGSQLKVRPDQDHEAHCTAHLLMLQVPGFAQSPAGQVVFRHAVEHELWGIWARSASELGMAAQNPQVAAEMQMRGLPPQMPMPGQPMPPDMENGFAKKTAAAMQAVVEKIKAMVPLPPGMTDPAMIQAETNAKEVDLRDEREREKIALQAREKDKALLVDQAQHNDKMALEYEKLTTGVEQDQVALEAQLREGVAQRHQQSAMQGQKLNADHAARMMQQTRQEQRP
jgi:chaperonin GroES